MKTIEINAMRTVMNARLTSAEDIFTFVMDRNNGITVPMLDEALMDAWVSFNKKDVKSVKARLFAEEAAITIHTEKLLNKETHEDSAMGETPVAETKPKEMVNVSQKQEMSGNEKGWNRSHAVDPIQAIMRQSKGYEADVYLDRLMDQLHKYVSGLGEYNVVIKKLFLFETPKKYGRIGYVDVVIPKGMMEIKTANQEKKKFEWVEFGDYNYNAEKPHNIFDAPQNAGGGLNYNLQFGSGLLRLSVYEGDTGVYVRWPQDKNRKTGVRYDVLRTRDIRFDYATPQNNSNVQAALTAAIQVFWNEYRHQLPTNRTSVYESCKDCVHNTYVSTKDGVDDDLDGVKSNKIFDNSDGEAQMDSRAYMPNQGCLLLQTLTDYSVTQTLNDDALKQRELRVDGFNELEWENKGTIRFGTRVVKIADARREGTRDTAESCNHFHAKGAKSKTAIAREKEEKGFATTSWREGGKPYRQLIQSEVGHEWANGLPGDVEGQATDIRVKGIGGVIVTFEEEFKKYMNFNATAGIITIEKEGLTNDRLINQIYHAAFNRDTMTVDQFESVLKMVMEEKPADLTAKQDTRWEGAAKALEESIMRAMAKEERVNRPDFTTKFYGGFDHFIAEHKIVADPDFIVLAEHSADEVHVEDVITKTLFRMAEGGLDFEYDGDITGPEFVRFLDEVADDYVQEVLMSGLSYVVTGGEDDDHKHLVASAMQRVLSNQVKALTYGVETESDSFAAFDKLNVAEDVLEYVAMNSGLLNK